MWGMLARFGSMFTRQTSAPTRTTSLVIPATSDPKSPPKRPSSIGSKPRPASSHPPLDLKRPSPGMVTPTKEATVISVGFEMHQEMPSCTENHPLKFDNRVTMEKSDRTVSEQEDQVSNLLETALLYSEISKDNQGDKDDCDTVRIDQKEKSSENEMVLRKRKTRVGAEVHGRPSRIIRQSSMRMVQKIREQCALCKKAMNEEDYLQLACTHRFHPQCAYKMQERNRYSCDICRGVKARLSSIAMLKGRRGTQGQFKPEE